MERLTADIQGTGYFHGLREGVLRLVWAMRHHAAALTQSFGVWGWGLLVTLLLALGALMALDDQQGEARRWRSRYAEAWMNVAKPAETMLQPPVSSDGRQRLAAFEQLLLPHQDIPLALQDLLRLAEDSGLSIQRAEYQTQIDIRGEFLRYRIHFPVRGTAETVNQYLYAALLQQKNLALESVQLKRDALDSPDLEARIQWVLLTRLPSRVEIQGVSP
jgi:hypothetical protein